MALSPQIIQDKFKTSSKLYTSYPLSQVVKAFQYKNVWYVKALQYSESWAEYKPDYFQKFFTEYEGEK